MATDWHQILVRLTPNTYAKLRRQSDHLAIPPAVLARTILTQQLDTVKDPNERLEYPGDRLPRDQMSRAERRRLDRERKKGAR